jgi:hypothetical protein
MMITQQHTTHDSQVTPASQRAASRASLSVNSTLALTLVLLLAAVLRIYHITDQGIWFDEAFAWNIIIQENMLPRIATDTHPPLYYVMLRAWVAVAGESPLALRYLSALTSLMTVAFVYRAARELTYGRPALRYGPLLAALVLALSDAEIFLAQETRNYAQYTFFASVSMWLYLRWIRRPSRVGALAWALSTTALVYTHYQGAFIPAIQGLHALIFLRGRLRLLALGTLALSGALFMPWFLGVTIPQARYAIDNSLPFAIPSNAETLLRLRDSYLGAQWPLMLVLAVVGLWALRRPMAAVLRSSGIWSPHEPAERWRRWGHLFLVVMWFVLPFSVLFFGNYFASLLTERKLLIIAPALALMIGLGLATLPTPARSLLAAALVIYGVSTVDYYRVKEPWNTIAADAARYVQPTDLALMEIGVGQYPMIYYFTQTLPEAVTISTFPVLRDATLGETNWPDYYDGVLLDQLAANQNSRIGPVATAWMVFWSKERAALERLENAGYQRTMTATYDHLGNDIALYRYDHILEATQVTTYEPGMTLRAAEIDAEALRVDLWWSTDDALAADYTTSALLFDQNEQLVAQLDSAPADSQRPTTTWQAGEIIYDPKPLQLVDGLETLPPGTYTVAVQVYQWTPDGIQQQTTADGAPWAVVGTLTRGDG